MIFLLFPMYVKKNVKDVFEKLSSKRSQCILFIFSAPIISHPPFLPLFSISFPYVISLRFTLLFRKLSSPELAFPNVHDTCQTPTLQHGGTGHFHLVPLFFLRRAGQVAANAHRADKVSDTVCTITRTPCAYYFRHGRLV